GERVVLCSFTEIGLDHPSTTTADRAGIGQADLLRRPARILMYRQQARNTATLRILRSYQMTGTFGSHHEHIDGRGRHDLPEMDIKTVTEREVRSRLQIWADLLSIDCRLRLIRCEDHDHIGRLHGIGDRHDLEPALLRLAPGTAFAKADHDRHTAFFHVERMGMALAAVTDDGDFLARDLLKIGIFIVINLHRRLPMEKG